MVLFIDKNKKVYSYNVHLVNKSNNKRFLKRYEHYKKVFYEKMEERVLGSQNTKESEVNQKVENKYDLNKTL